MALNVIKIFTETEKEINCMSDIKKYIFKELSLHEQKTALEFIGYLENVGCSFYKDASACWKDKIYYWVKFGEKCVCFIAIKDPDEPGNHWTVWSDDMDSEWIGKYPVDERTKEIAYKYVDHCGHCGSCGGGRHKVIFGKEFNDICGCTFRIDNLAFDDLFFLKKIVEIRIKEIMLRWQTAE